MNTDPFARVKRIKGVRCAVVFDDSGHCVMEAPGNSVPADLMARVLGLVRIGTGYCDTLAAGESPREFVAEFDRGRLFARFFGTHVILVLTTRLTPAARVTVALNAAAVCLAAKLPNA